MDLESGSAIANTVSPIDDDELDRGALGSGPASSGQVPAGSDEVIVGKSWKRAANKPSAEEIRRHMISRVPYRSWCERCVRGKAKDGPHHRVTREEWETEPVYTWDYMYLKTGNGKAANTGPGEASDLRTSPS